MNEKQLAELAANLYTKKQPLDSLHQEIAENFYPERAEFTYRRSIGDDFASNLMTSYPVVSRRSLGDQFTTMLRPTARSWFHPARKFSEKDKEPDLEVRTHLEWVEQVMRRAMYDPVALFNRATKLGDHDYAAFGQTCLSIELNRNRDALLYRCWHLRDMAWQENEEGQLGFICRKWKPTVRQANDYFKGKLHQNVVNKVNKTPFDNVELLHIVCDAEMFSESSNGRPRWSIWWDMDNESLIEKTPIWGKHYIIPRWQIVGSQYSYSPAVVAALPDARLIQAMTYTLLEVSEKASNPPIVATKDSVRSDVALYAGGITWVDQDYDERLGEALRPLSQDFRGINFGMDMAGNTQLNIQRAFYLDTLTLPQRAPEMTAYEVGQRIQEYIRNALPIFEPTEAEYNAAVCEETYALMARNGAFGSPKDWPKALQTMDIEFHFESPLHDVIEQQKAQKWLEGRTLLADAVALEPNSAYVWDSTTALRDALAAVGVPAKWLRSRDDADALIEAAQEQQQAQQLMDALEQGSKTAEQFSKAEQASSAAGAI